MKRIFTSIGFVIFQLSLFAQVPSNNDCSDAITLTELNNHCSQQLFGEPTFDIIDGNCAPTFNPALNIWYKFTAVGTTVTIGASGGSNLYKITIVSFPFGPCGVTETIDCNTSVLTNTSLIIGEEYYVIISSSNSAANFELCINNPVPNPPPNDNPCNATLLVSNVTSCGTTIDATSNFPAHTLPCPTVGSNQVWYTVTVPAGETNLEINLLASTLSGGAQLIIGQWTNGCTGTFQYQEANVYCGPAINTFEFSCMDPGTYHIMLSSNNAGAGAFCITARTYGSPPGCSLNDVCVNAVQVPALELDQNPVCVSGCNIGACGEDFTTPGCNYNGGVVWYSVTIPAGASVLNITVNSADGSLVSPQLQIFSGGCNNLTAVTGCNIGGNGNLNLLGFEVSINTTYLIAVGNNSGTTGTFDICFSVSDPTTLCSLGHEITVTGTSLGSPLNGPYLPGEEVSFVYLFEFTSNSNGIQWPHGVVPVAGPCWDNPNNGFQNGSNGNWQWFDNPIVTYNSTNPFVRLYYGPDGDAKLCFWLDPTCTGAGLAPEDIMPPGWWHVNQPGQCGDDLNDPNNTWGQPCGNTCAASFNFTLTTKSFDECDGDQSLLDCGLQFYVFSDFQTGCWLTGGDNTCAADYPGYFQASLNCCDAPKVDTASFTICSGATTEIELESNQSDFEVLFDWTISSDSGIEGASSGEGPFIRQTLINKSSLIRTVYFNVRGQNNTGCRGQRSRIRVDVLPDIDITITTDPENGCTEESFDISASTIGGSGGPYSYIWSYLQTSDSAIVGISPGLQGEFPISVTVTDNAGCSNVASTSIKVGPVEEIEFQMEKSVFCYNEGEIVLKATPPGGEWESSDSEIVIENNVLNLWQLDDAGIYEFIYHNTNSDCPSSKTFSLELIYSARDCPDKSIEVHTDDTESPLTGTIYSHPFLTNLTENTEVRIYDTLGKELYYNKNYQNDWNPDRYPAGMYFFIVTIEGKTFQKVVSVIK